jgi:hypothetical protein
MKKIKVKYCQFAGVDHTKPNTTLFFIHNILTTYYDVEVCHIPADKPDYVFFHESTWEYLDYDCIRIFYTAENVSPNFNLTDYAMANDIMDFGDRYHRLSSYLVATFYNPKELELAEKIDISKPRPFTREDLAKKTEFCSFVYSNYLADERRKQLYDKIDAYKHINSGGRYLNNIGGPTDNKLGFELRHKFSMAIENSCRDGYTTDRIACAYMANAIPIYWGNPAITIEFNPKSFINCHEFASFDDVVARIKEVDNDDELYIRMKNEPIFAEGFTMKGAIEGFETWLRHIIDQPLADAPRRTINQARAAEMERNERVIWHDVENRNARKRLLAKLYRPFKRFGKLEEWKRAYFRKKIQK